MTTLADAFPDELPTRPDLPNVCASRCVHCGRVFGEHAVSVPPVPPPHMWSADCFGMRVNFTDERSRDDDRTR